MTTFYLDYEGGNDANDGTTFANRWKTFTNGPTAARIGPGDTIRIMASLEPTEIGNCSWTQYSKTVTLPAPITANISDCENVWTGSANVTSSAHTSDFKEGTKSARFAIASGFTTGKVAFFATGLLDLSAFQQVSFWFSTTVATSDSTFTLHLCSDTSGDVSVHAINIPAIPSSTNWCPVTIDTGAPLSSSIQSVALYANTDPGSITVNIDNILACKAASSPDSLTLSSLLGKAHNLTWQASTLYAVNNIRKPTQPNRNGYRYKVIAQTGNSGSSEPSWPEVVGATVIDGGVTWQCEGLEDTWYPIQSINGTTVKLDNHPVAKGNEGRGYSGETETVSTYKREPIQVPFTNGAQPNFIDANDSGSIDSFITYSGGWNRTDMSLQSGETWYSRNGYSSGLGSYLAASQANIAFENLNFSRFYHGMYFKNIARAKIKNCHFVGCVDGFSSTGTYYLVDIQNCLFFNSNTYGSNIADSSSGSVKRCGFNNNNSSGIFISSISTDQNLHFENIHAKNNGAYGFYSQNQFPNKIINLETVNNASGSVRTLRADLILIKPLLSEATQFEISSVYIDNTIFVHNYQQIADSHYIATDGGTIVSATDQRHKASGISWKFRPTSTNRNIYYPLKLSVAKIACTANVTIRVRIWTRRDSTNIKGELYLSSGQLAGVAETSIACEPDINTWTQSSDLTFTPTETGVLELYFKVWDGVGTTNNYWIDDLSVR